MKNKVFDSLTPELISLLQSERLVSLATIDHETNGPNVSAISWVFAMNEKEIRFAVDHKSRIVENIRHNEQVVLHIIGAGSCYSISGKASVNQERMEDVPLKLSRISIQVTDVRDVMFYGSRISVEPKYEKTYDEEAAAKLDRQVLSALKA